MLGSKPSCPWSAVISGRIGMPSLRQTLSLGPVSHPRKTLDVDLDTKPVGIYSDTKSSLMAKQLEVSHRDGQHQADAPTVADGEQRPGGFVVSGLIRWLITALLLMGFVLAVHFYQGRVLNNNDKSIFESIIVTLSLVVGLNIASALKDIAKHMRWWFLSLKRRNLSEVREIPLVTPVLGSQVLTLKSLSG